MYFQYLFIVIVATNYKIFVNQLLKILCYCNQVNQGQH